MVSVPTSVIRSGSTEPYRAVYPVSPRMPQAGDSLASVAFFSASAFALVE
jgi:hypothetical protein